jgi:hypothetical protein
MRPFYHEGHVTVEGEQLTLVCNFRVIDVVESLTGEKMSDVLTQLDDPPSALAGKVLWAMLREKHEGVTLDEAAGVMFGPDKDEVGVVVGDIFRRAFNVGEEPKAKGKNPRKRRGASKAS